MQDSNDFVLFIRYCGTTLPPQSTSFSNVMTIIFEADSSVSHEGFSASYRMFDSREGKLLKFDKSKIFII